MSIDIIKGSEISRSGIAEASSTLKNMQKLAVGDMTVMKNHSGSISKDDIWEVTATNYPIVKWPRVMIRNVADYKRNPKVAYHVFDVSLLRKIL